MMLGQLLSSLGNSSDTGPGRMPQDTFRGYRIVEDIVPLDYPIYSLGEIYISGNEVHMGRSLAKANPSSFFATKPEAEVLASLGH